MGNYSDYLNECFNQLKTNMYDSGCRPILFAGTGISRRYIDAPDWKGLLNALIKENPNIKYPLGYYRQDCNDLSEVASKIIDDYFNLAWERKEEGIYPGGLYEYPDKSIFLKYTISDIIGKYMSDFKIEGHKYQEELLELSKLTPHAIITTNYDTLLETIFKGKYKPIIGQQVIRKTEVNKIGQIFKIHGCVSKPEEIVISKNDYINFKKKQKYLSAKLLTYFIEHPIVFIGYSLSDENIIGILNDIADMISVEDNLVENIWLIDWYRESLTEEQKPPSEKVINLGENKTIRINYIAVNDYVELFRTLYQGSSAEVDELFKLQDTVYNIVKSKTITNLEVDVISFKDVWTETNIMSKLGLKEIIEKSDSTSIEANDTFVNLSIIEDSEHVLAEYPYRISDIASKMGDDHWYRTNKLITEIEEKAGIKIKNSNNPYHIDVRVNGKNHRYSNELLKVLNKYINGEEVILINSDKQEIKITK